MFTYHLPTKIIFGRPAAEAVAEVVAGLSARRVLLVSDPGLNRTGLVGSFEAALREAGQTVTTFVEVKTNPTTASVHRALSLLNEGKAQAVVALGGGSPIDVAKAAAMLATNGGIYADYQWRGRPITRPSLPVVAAPTTAGTGSEVSRVAVIVDEENPFKKGVLSPLMFPYAAILDPLLTLSLPPQLTAATGIDALTHALEAYVGRQANPYTDMLAVQAMAVIRRYLPQAVSQGSNPTPRKNMLLASLWAGTAMDHAGLGLVHALSGPLTAALHLHHGLANGIILPYVLRFNLPAVPPEKKSTLKEIFGLERHAADGELVKAVAGFVTGLGLPSRLRDLDVSLAALNHETVAKDTLRMVLVKNNPRPVAAAECRELLEEMA